MPSKTTFGSGHIDLNALQQIVDTTWGRSSTPKTAAYSVKFSLVGEDLLKVMYVTIVNFGTERRMIETRRACADESIRFVNEVMKSVKTRYKDVTGESISFKEQSTNDSIEIIGLAVHNPNRTAYYRRFVFYEIS